MRASKQTTGTRVLKAKGKRVSLRCPLSIERTDLEYNFDASALQVCMTVENMGGGGMASDTVESAVIVVRLFDGEGKLLSCRGNEYFAKLLRFGDAGLASGGRITFRLLPECEGGRRAEDAEIYISRIRYTDGTVTDYVRGDFFDLPGEGIPIAKKFKKNPEEAAAALGEGALYVPEKLTEIVWRCTCGEFSESDSCPTCNRNKAELFAALDALLPAKAGKAAAAATVIDPPAEADSAPADDRTAEYSTSAAKAALAAMQAEAGIDSTASDGETDQEGDVPPVTPPLEETDKKTRNILLIAISAASVVLLAVILLLILTLCGRAEEPTPGTTDGPVHVDPPANNQDAERVVRSYLESYQFDNALGYALSAGCSDALIDEIYLSAMQYYLDNGQLDKATEWAQKTGDQAYMDTITSQRFYAALASGDYLTAMEIADLLPADRQAEAKAQAAEGYVNALVEQGRYAEAMAAADQYQTSTTSKQIAQRAVQAYLDEKNFNKAIAMARELQSGDLVISAASAATDHYIAAGSFDKAADYVGLTGNTEKMQTVLGELTDAQLRRHLPTFFSLLTPAKMMSIHSVALGSKPAAIAAIDTAGNVYLGSEKVYSSTRYVPVTDPETGEPVLDEETGEPLYQTEFVPAVSISCCDTAVIALLADGTVRIVEGTNNSYRQSDLDGWSDIVAISASYYHVLGLKADGTVVAVGSNVYGQCDTAAITNAVAISAGDNHSLILHADGRVTALGNNIAGICNVTGWSGIIAISAGSLHSIGLKADGTVVVVGNCNTAGWSDIVAVYSTATNAVAIRADGSLLCSVNNKPSDLLASVTDAVALSIGKQAVTILHADGTLSTVLLSGSTTPELPAAWKA